MKFSTRIHNTELEKEIKYQPVLMQGYIYAICAGRPRG